MFATLAEQARIDESTHIEFLARLIAEQATADRGRRVTARLRYARSPYRRTIDELAVEAGYRGYSTTADNLARTLVRALIEGNLTSKMKTFTAPTVLVIDDVGLLPSPRYSPDRMKDFTRHLWLLKLGALVNVWFLVDSFTLSGSIDAHIVVPAQIFFAVSAFRCLFPNRYIDNVVFHDTLFSSIFLTRLLATFVEVAWIYQFSRVIRLLNVDDVGWIDALSWLMVVQVVVSQCFVWLAITTGRVVHYFHEELGWWVIFLANTISSGYLYLRVGSFAAGESLLVINLLYGLGYLPWQLVHLRSLRAEATARGEIGEPPPKVTMRVVVGGLRTSIHDRKPTTDADDWGGIVGLIWMTGYWATLIPIWVHHVVGELGTR